MKTVLQPLNEKARDIIVNRVDLLEATSLEPLLLQLVAHVSAYRVILARSVPTHIPRSFAVIAHVIMNESQYSADLC